MSWSAPTCSTTPTMCTHTTDGALYGNAKTLGDPSCLSSIIYNRTTPRGLWQKRGNSLKNLFRKTQPQPIARSFFAATRRGAVRGRKNYALLFSD